MRGVAVVMFLVSCGRLGFGGDSDASGDAVALEPGLVVWYRMDDDPTDGNLEDSAGRDHAAICAAGFTCGSPEPAVAGQGLRLQAGQYYRLPFEPALTMPMAFTVALWARPEVINRMMFVTKRDGPINNSWGIFVDTTGQVVFESSHGMGTGDTYEELRTTQSVQVGAWVHFAISWDDVSKRIYLNGARVGLSVPLDIAFDMGEVLIGCDEDDGIGPAGFTTGVLDDIRIYDRVLSDTEIAALVQ